MKYPIEEIAYKMKFIMDKLDNGEKLDAVEEAYVKKIMNFKSIYDSMCLECQLKNVKIEQSKVLRYLMEKRAELLKTIKGTKSKNKLEQMHFKVKNIERFVSSGAVAYFKDFLLDHNEIAHVDVYQYFQNLARKDQYLAKPSFNDGYFNTPYFIVKNNYTGEVRLNRPLINLARLVIAGDFKIYNAIEKKDRLLRSKTNITDMDELVNSIPEEYRNIDLKSIDRIIYYGRGRIGDKDDHTFDDTRDNLDILFALDQVKDNQFEPAGEDAINKAIVNVLNGIIAGTYKPIDFLNYHILGYFDSQTDDTKFREILNENKFNLDAIQKKVLQDDLLATTSLNSSHNLFLGLNGELRLDNISLAASIMNGEEINEGECLTADPGCLERIKYYQPAHRPNIHDYERDKYDIKILQAIARYRVDLKKNREQEQVNKENKALL